MKYEMVKVLSPTGEVNKKLMPKLSNQDIKNLYEAMVLGRAWDQRALQLQREGRMGTIASIRGQEAAQVGVAYAMDKDDWLFPSFREAAAQILRGMPMEMLYQYWGGDERGMKIPEGVNIFTVAVPVSTQIPHAVGFAWASKMRKEKYATVVFFGDGATSKGDFHEGLNFAGTFKVPIVFVCQNNQWAISVPRSRQTASETIAQKAEAYGFEGILVDGNDVFAVYKVAKYALEKAKAGKGPTLIECYTYRIGDHTTADDASRYRSQKEVDEWVKKDPIDRLRKFMEKKKLWNKDYEKNLLDMINKKIDAAVSKYESTPPAPIEDIFKYQYAEMPWHLKEQLEKLKEDQSG